MTVHPQRTISNELARGLTLNGKARLIGDNYKRVVETNPALMRYINAPHVFNVKTGELRRSAQSALALTHATKDGKFIRTSDDIDRAITQRGTTNSPHKAIHGQNLTLSDDGATQQTASDEKEKLGIHRIGVIVRTCGDAQLTVLLQVVIEA